jgi:hypothetical protein
VPRVAPDHVLGKLQWRHGRKEGRILADRLHQGITVYGLDGMTVEAKDRDQE